MKIEKILKDAGERVLSIYIGAGIYTLALVGEKMSKLRKYEELVSDFIKDKQFGYQMFKEGFS